MDDIDRRAPLGAYGEPRPVDISVYLVSQDDKAINPELERFYAKRIGARTSEIKASHVAFLSHPREVARLIETAAR